MSGSTTTAKMKPWSRSAAWWALVVEGIVALGLGLMGLLSPVLAGRFILLGLALFLFVNGILSLIGWTRRRRRGFLLYHGLFATIVGLVLLLMGWFEVGGSPLLAWVLGISFLVAGVLHIGVYARKGNGRQMGQLINALVSFALGGIILAGQIWQIPVLAWLSWLLIAIGVALLIVGFVVRSRGEPGPAAPTPPPTKSAAKPAPAPASEPGASATDEPAPELGASGEPDPAAPAASTQPATSTDDSSPEADSNTDVPAA